MNLFEAREKLVNAALRMLQAERGNVAWAHYSDDIDYAEEGLVEAAKDLVEAAAREEAGRPHVAAGALWDRDTRQAFVEALTSRTVLKQEGLEPSAAHWLLLSNAYWDWNPFEFGAPTMDPKRPYGNSAVEDDLARILPDLSEEDRVRVHCELPAVLWWICRSGLPK